MVKVRIVAYSPTGDENQWIWSVYINRQPTRAPFDDGDVVGVFRSGDSLIFEYNFKPGDYFYFAMNNPPEITYDVIVYINDKIYARGKVNRDSPMKVEYRGVPEDRQLSWWNIVLIAGVLALFLLRKK